MATDLIVNEILETDLSMFESQEMNGIFIISVALKDIFSLNNSDINLAIFGGIFQSLLNGKDITSADVAKLNAAKQHMYIWKGMICTFLALMTNVSD